MEALTENAPPPVELRLAWMCEKWGTLPDAGGLYEQDYQTLTRMTGLSSVYNAVMSWRVNTGERVHLITHQHRTILKWLNENGINFNVMQANIRGLE